MNIKFLKKLWDKLPEGRPMCVPEIEAWGVKREEEQKKKIKKMNKKLKMIKLKRINRKNNGKEKLFIKIKFK